MTALRASSRPPELVILNPVLRAAGTKNRGHGASPFPDRLSEPETFYRPVSAIMRRPPSPVAAFAAMLCLRNTAEQGRFLTGAVRF